MSSARLASVAVVVLLLGAACAHRPTPPSPSPSPSPSRPAEANVERTPDPPTAAAADQAAERWARFLAEVGETCRTTWPDDESACASAHAVDRPRAYADCEDRCGTARRLSIAEALPGAVDACTSKRGTSIQSACGRLRSGRAAGRMLEEAIERCEDGCESARAETRIERNRPKTRAEELACLRECVGRHGGAKLVVERGGDFHVESTSWCGTPAFTCAVNCAPAGKAIRSPL